MVLMNPSKKLITDEAKAYSIHYMLHNGTKTKLNNNQKEFTISSILADLYYGSNSFDATLGIFHSSIIDYHPGLVALVGYFDYWCNHNNPINLSNHELMDSFYQWLIDQKNMPQDVLGLAAFILKNQDDNDYWHNKIIEDVFRHFKDFMLAFLDEQYIGSMPGSSVDDIKKAIITAQDAYDYSSYFASFFPELTDLFAYFGYWHSNNHHSKGHKEIFTVQFPKWLKDQLGINMKLLKLYDTFASWYPHRKIVKGRNYKNWGYNV